MSNGQTAEEFLYERLLDLGYTRTDCRTETAQIWIMPDLRRHLVVPDACDGFYPSWLHELILEQAKRVGDQDLVSELDKLRVQSLGEKTVQ